MKKKTKKVYTKEDWKIAGIITAIGIVIILIVGAKTSDNIASSTSSSVSDFRNGQSVTLTADLPACITKENLDRLDNIMREKNKDAQTEMLISGDVIVISSGSKIEIVDKGVFTTKVKYIFGEYYGNTEFIEE
ncbi:hypothetical protein [Clostridium tagluense]|uniref:hypothetical protein n=1 Tax=Clostridium tagluense TaxID=360422 RepID=UPI001C0B2CD4|nr:hypothetical protein [Clostridium tagluense]MBU3126047.1 hypothetical protein [Clostridium tagluense]